MKKLLLLVSVLLWTGSAWAGHSHNLVSAAHRLDREAHHFYEQLKYYTHARHAAKDAKTFAHAAKHFHKQVEYGASAHHLWRDFDDLLRLYHHLHREFRHAHGAHHDRHSVADFRQVSSAFGKLEYAMNARKRYSWYGHHHRDYAYGRKGHKGHGGRRYGYRPSYYYYH